MAGDAEAIALLIRTHQPDLQRFARKVCPTWEDADDAVQHALIVLSTRLNTFDRLAKLSTWLFAIIKYECIRFINRARRRLSIGRRPVEYSESPERTLSDGQLLQRLTDAVTKLEPKYRETFILRDIEGLSANEVCKQLGISVSSMKSRLHRSREALRAALASDQPD